MEIRGGGWRRRHSALGHIDSSRGLCSGSVYRTRRYLELHHRGDHIDTDRNTGGELFLVIYGERAYFDYVNAQGGVNGRKIDYKYAVDDGGNPTTFNQLANTLINQDHVFAVTGVATIFFSPSLFVESGIPTYGYNVTDNWAGAPNLFAAGGSTQYYQAGAAEFAYVARHTQAKPSIALVAYGVAASSDACQAAETALKAEGYDVSYVDLNINYPGSTVATDVQRMKTSGTNFVPSCMDVQGNVTMARAIQQYGLKATQLWLNGNDVPTLEANKTLMQGIYSPQPREGGRTGVGHPTFAAQSRVVHRYHGRENPRNALRRIPARRAQEIEVGVGAGRLRGTRCEAQSATSPLMRPTGLATMRPAISSSRTSHAIRSSR